MLSPQPPAMRVSVEYNVEYSTTTAAPRALRTADPGAPDLSFLTRDFADGVAILLRHHRSHRGRQPGRDRTIAGAGRQGASRPARRGGRRASSSRSSCRRSVRAGRSARSSASSSSSSPIRCSRRSAGRAPVFQPPFGPVLVVDGDAVRDVLERDQEFTVEPYGVEMMKVMSPLHNGGFSTFMLSTDDNARVRAGQAAAVGGVQPAGCRRDHRGDSPGLRSARGGRGGGRADDRLVDDRRRADRRPLRARDARPPVPRRSRGGTAGIASS